MRTVIREIIETVLLALVVYLALQVSVQPYRVEGSSMVPTLAEGEYLLVNKMVYWQVPLLGGDDGYLVHPPQTGEVVIFRFPDEPTRNFVKRVIGVPGDTVEITEGTVYVNGKALDEPYVRLFDRGTMDPFEVPPDSYFVLGDNRGASDDSRSWGVVPAENVIGRAWVTYWPPGHLERLFSFR